MVDLTIRYRRPSGREALYVGLLVCLTLVFVAPDPLRGAPRRTSNECRICHKEAHREWALSAHAHSYCNPSFQERYQRLYRPQECLACHAPLPLNETGGFRQPPKPRRKNLVDGVSCITCHAAGPYVDGPRGLMRSGFACGNRAYETPEVCAPCHGQPCRCFSSTKGRHQRQLGDWFRGPYRHKTSCQECHMPEKVRRVAQMRSPELRAGVVHDHSLPGVDDAAFLKTAVAFRIERQADEVILSLVNACAGHCVPGSEGRTLVLRLTFLDDANLEMDHRTEYLDERSGNRLEPGGSKVYSYLLRDGWQRVKVSILYRHYTEQPERHWLLLHHRIFDLQRPHTPPPRHPIADELRRLRKRRKRLWSETTTVSEWDP